MSIPSPKTTIPLALAAALGLGAALVSFGRMQAGGAAPAAPTAVAVVNIRQVMLMAKEAESLKADLKAKGDEAAKEIDKRRKNLDAMKEKSKMMISSSAEYAQLESEYTEATIQLEGYQKFQQEKMGRFSNLAELTLYRHVCARAAKLAESKGYDVLLDNTFTQEDLEKISPSKLAIERFIGGDRTLLWAKKTADLTDDVVAVMNNEFNQRGAAAPAAQPGPLAPAAPATVGPTIPAK